MLKNYIQTIIKCKNFKNNEFNLSWIKILINYCEKKNRFFFSVFDEYSLKYLKQFNFSKYKIASSEATNYKFLKKLSKVIKHFFYQLMCDLQDVKRAMQNFKNKAQRNAMPPDYPLNEKCQCICINRVQKTFSPNSAGIF